MGLSAETRTRLFRSGSVTVMAVLAISAKAAAQVGLSSQIQSIGLVVRVPEQASFQQLAPSEETVSGTIRESSVRVRLSASNGYRLVVRGVGPEAARVSVRSVDGVYQPLLDDAPVTVGHYAKADGELEQEVEYRSESGGASAAGTPLPVRYEVLVDPIL